jgi:NAD(P)-dependent dehydrogenase (short-subunit alcohol dehydrogenase family)
MNRSNPLESTGRTVLVTGASSGIGRETAVVMSELGARVIVTGRRAEALAATAARMTPRSHAIEPFDLNAVDAIAGWLEHLASRYGPLDGLVHAAGLQKTAGLRAVSVEMVQETFRVNVESAVMLVKAFRQKRCRAEASSVVLVSSVRALVGAPATAVYAASKAALIGLTRSLASELAREGIRVNCIAPGMVESEMTDQIRRTLTDDQFQALVAEHPLGLGTPTDVAYAAAYLLSDAARWMTGHTLVVDGGLSAT